VLLYVAAVAPRDLPATMSHALSALNPAQRRRIYEYCVEVARSSNKSSHIADEDLNLLEDTRCSLPHALLSCCCFRIFIAIGNKMLLLRWMKFLGQ